MNGTSTTASTRHHHPRTSTKPPPWRSARLAPLLSPKSTLPGTQPRGGCNQKPAGATSQAPRRAQARPGVEAGAVGEGSEVVVAHEVPGPHGPRAALGHEAPLHADVGAVPRGLGGGHRRRLAGRPAHQQRRQQQQRPAAGAPPPPPPHGRRPRHGGPGAGQPQGALGGEGRDGGGPALPLLLPPLQTCKRGWSASTRDGGGAASAPAPPTRAAGLRSPSWERSGAAPALPSPGPACPSPLPAFPPSPRWRGRGRATWRCPRDALPGPPARP